MQILLPCALFLFPHLRRSQFSLLRIQARASLFRLMKRTLLLVLPVIVFGTACERHSASSLPSHGGGHAEGHAPADAHAEKAPAKETPAPSAPATPKDAPAAKFFDQKSK